MTNRELEILNIIRRDPMISQQELADTLGITRSSASVHITNLIKKGHILGKGYIVSEGEYACVIGGANIDIQGFPSGKLVDRDSNPGSVKLSSGGVGRNIAENLVRLGVDTRLISVIGDDLYGRKITEEARQIGLNMEDSLVLGEGSTSTYMAILDEMGDMALAISQMGIYDKMTIDFIKQKRHLIENARLCIIDTNITGEVIEYILNNFRDTVFFLDTVSTSKALRVRDLIGLFHTIKPNKIEAEILSGIEINGEGDIIRASEYFLRLGVKRVFISLGREGVFFNDGKSRGHIRANEVRVINATGAGDAFVAGLAYSFMENLDVESAARFATAASIVALSHENTINPLISVEKVYNKMKELEL